MAQAWLKMSQVQCLIWWFDCMEMLLEAEELAVEQTAVCSERPSRRESNMLSHEDDKAPHQTHPHTKGIFGMLTMLAFHWTAMGASKGHPAHTPTGLRASTRCHGLNLKKKKKEAHHKAINPNQITICLITCDLTYCDEGERRQVFSALEGGGEESEDSRRRQKIMKQFTCSFAV